MNHDDGGIDMLPSHAPNAASSPESASAHGGQISPSGQTDGNTPSPPPHFEHIVRVRQVAGEKPQQDCLEAFAAQVRAFALALPSEGSFQDLSRQFLLAAEDLQTPLILSVCGEFHEGQPALLTALLGEAAPDDPTGEPRPSAAVLQYTNRASLIACGESGPRRAGTLEELKKLAREDSSRSAALGRILAQLILDPFRDRSRNCLLLFVPGYIPSLAGSGDTAFSLLRRAGAIVWLATASRLATIGGSGASGHSGQPLDLLVASDLDRTRAGDAGQPSAGDTAPVLVLRDVQERFGDLFRDSRLAQMREAVLRLSGSPALHAAKIRNAVSRVQEGAEELTRRLEKLVNTVHGELDAARAQPASVCGSKASQEETVRRWEERRCGSSAWLSAAEEGKLEECLSASLRQEWVELRAEFDALGKEQRSLQREQARNLEERRFHERRHQEILEDQQRSASQNLVLQILSGLLGKDSDGMERELAAAQALGEQCWAEEGELKRTADALARRGDEIADAARQLAGKIAVHMRSAVQKSAFLTHQRPTSLRKARWLLQANAAVVAAAAPVARFCTAIEEAAIDLRDQAPEDVPFVPCIKALRECRRACDALLPLRAYAGNARMLRIYRRLLSRQRQAMETAVTDCGGVLRALDTALEQAPREELWRELSSCAASGNTPLAQFAEGMAAWLCEPDLQGTESALRALARVHVGDRTMAEFGDFLRRHGGEQSEAFLPALPSPAPSHLGDVLRSAPRSSPAYRQAILKMGGELLDLFETASETE